MSSANISTPSSASSQSQEESIGGGDEDSLPLSNYPIIPREELTLGAQLGAGSYGSVYRGVWKNGSKEIPVALKKVFMLEKEADILSKVRHRNIIQFFGVSHTNPDFFIVTDFAENGSLYDYVHKACANEIEFDQILTWAIQIAQGVAYLHYEAPDTIIHRDLKSKNVVLSGDWVCKLCDFGTSKNLTHSWTAPSWGGTAAWMSPEIINQKEGITTATDVWSYGVVLWEMISREIPYKGLTEFSIYSMIAQQGVTLVIPEECPFDLADLMRNCWKIIPKDRCDMRQVVVTLESMKANTEFTEQCGVFLRHKKDWKCVIEKQLKQLEEQKINYAKKMEELTKWERALKRREESQRELMVADSHGIDDVALWDENHVCQWIKKISAGLMSSDDTLNLPTLFIHHNINGSRLLKISLKDLENLGIRSYATRVILRREIQNLCKENQRMKNFPTLEVSQQQLDQQKRNDKLAQPLCLSLIVHVAMYTRQSGFDFLPKFRYKIVVDTDWENTHLANLRIAHSVVKDVFISLIYEDKTPLYESFRCIRGPFVVGDWIDSPVSGSGVGIVCAISYSDRVIRPRSTSIRTKIFDFSRPQTLENKKVELVIRAGFSASPCKNPLPIGERHQYKTSSSADSGVSMSSSLQGVWRNRAVNGSSANEISDALPTAAPQRGQKSPLWADIAAGLRTSGSPSPLPVATDSSKNAVPSSLMSTADCDAEVPTSSTSLLPDRFIDPTINQFFAPGSLFRDSILVTRPSNSNYRNSLDHVGKTFRYHPRQQVANRKSNSYRIRRRPVPIILPARRKIGSMSFNREDNEVFVRINSFERSSQDPTSDYKDPAEEDSINGPESVKKRRRRRHRPHKRGNANSQEQTPEAHLDVQKDGLSRNMDDSPKDVLAKQNHEYVHGGCNKWSWKVYGREPE